MYYTNLGEKVNISMENVDKTYTVDTDEEIVECVINAIGKHYDLQDITDFKISDLTKSKCIEIIDLILDMNGAVFIVVPDSLNKSNDGGTLITRKMNLSYESLDGFHILSKQQIQSLIVNNKQRHEILCVSERAWKRIENYREKCYNSLYYSNYKKSYDYPKNSDYSDVYISICCFLVCIFCFILILVVPTSLLITGIVLVVNETNPPIASIVLIVLGSGGIILCFPFLLGICIRCFCCSKT